MPSEADETRDGPGPDAETVGGPRRPRGGDDAETVDAPCAGADDETAQLGLPQPSTPTEPADETVDAPRAHPDDETAQLGLPQPSTPTDPSDETVDAPRSHPDDETAQLGLPVPSTLAEPSDETVDAPGAHPGDETTERSPPRASGEPETPSPFRPRSTREPDSAPTRPPPDAPSPQRLGGYAIESELARGGMGVVYVARDPKLDRRVAIKVLRAGEGATEAQLERFRREARAASRLRHPNLVRVYEVGDEAGTSYLVMDLVPGRSLADALSERGAFPSREAARLTRQLAAALQHAHEHAILHRDVKPANVLVDDDGTPCLTDFGLAKEVSESGVTITGEVLGTPSYMAPEQADGDLARIDRRADVYGLGATLYALLTGRAPFQAGSVLATLEQVRAGDPTPPRALRGDVERDLETICLRCLETDPAERYPTAGALGDDLQRFLDDLPIAARRPGLTDRGRKWLRRNQRLATVSAGLVGCAALVIVAGSAWFSLRLRAALDDAQLHAKNAEAQAERARDAERAAAREARASREVADVAVSTLSKLGHELREGLTRLPGPGARKLRQRIVEQITADLAELRRLGIEDANLTMLEIFLSHEDRSRAARPVRLRALERARALAASLADDSPERALAGEQILARCLDTVGDDHYNSGELTAAEPIYLEALALRRGHVEQAESLSTLRALGTSLRAMFLLRSGQGARDAVRPVLDEWVAITSRVAALDPDDLTLRFERCRAEVAFAEFEREQGRFDACEARLTPAEGALSKLLGARPGDREARTLLGDVYEARGELAEARAGYEAAIPFQERALETARRVASENPTDTQAVWDVARRLERLANLQSNTGQTEAARVNGEESARLFSSLAESQPGNATAQSGRATALALLGELSLQAGEFDAARAKLEEAVEVLERLLAQRPRSPVVRYNLAVYHFRLSGVAEAEGNMDEAIEALLEAIRIQEPPSGADPPADVCFQLMRYWRDVYRLEHDRVEPAVALAHAREGLRWARRYHELAPQARAALIQLGNQLYLISTLAEATGDAEGALAAIQEARERVDAHLEHDDSDLNLYRNRSVYLRIEAKLLSDLGRHTAALNQAQEGLAHHLRVSQRHRQSSSELRLFVWSQLEILARAWDSAPREDLLAKGEEMLRNYAELDSIERRALADLRETTDDAGRAGIDAQFREREAKLARLRNDPGWAPLREGGLLERVLKEKGL